MLSIRIQKTERSDTTNRHSSIINSVPDRPSQGTGVNYEILANFNGDDQPNCLRSPSNNDCPFKQFRCSGGFEKSG